MFNKFIHSFINALATANNSTFTIVISIIAAVGCLGCYITYKILHYKHLKDPDFVAEQKSREEAYKRKRTAEYESRIKAENEELERLFQEEMSDYSYADDEAAEDNAEDD